MTSEHNEPNPRYFYGWNMAIIGFFVIGLGFGNQYTLGVFIYHYVTTYHVSLASVSLFTAGTASIAIALYSPVIGLLARHHSLRNIIATGLVLASVGYVLLPMAPHFWMVSLIYAVFFAAGTSVSIVAGSTLVANWFVHRRALALGLATSGTFAAGAVLTPLMAYALNAIGFRSACLALAAVIAVLVPIVLIFVADKPESMGLNPDGVATAVAAVDPRVDHGEVDWNFRELLKNRTFWVIAAAFGIFAGVTGTLETDFIAIANDSRIDGQTAAKVFSLYSIIAFIATNTIGFAFQRMSPRLIMMTAATLMGLSCALLIGRLTYSSLVAASVLLGIGVGASTLAPRVLAAEYFGRNGFGLVLGSAMPFMVLAYVLMLPLFGHAYDRFHNYDVALWGLIGSLVTLSAALLIFLPRKPTRLEPLA